MKKSRYKEEQIVSILREAESSTVTATARQHGVAEQNDLSMAAAVLRHGGIGCPRAEAITR